MTEVAAKQTFVPNGVENSNPAEEKAIGEYHDAEKYGVVNDDNWYCKYGYVPSTKYYVNLYGSDKTIMEFGCADGEYTIDYAENVKKAYALSLFETEIEAAKKNAAGKSVESKIEFICHDCSIPKKFAEVDFTYSNWMLNNAKDMDMLRRMCEMLYINTKPGGKTLILLATADNLMGQLIEQQRHVKITDIKALKDEDGTVIGLVVDKSLTGDTTEGFFLRDWFYSDSRVIKVLNDIGYKNVHQVPTLPLTTDIFGDPIQQAKFIDETHYKFFLCDKPLLKE